VLTLTATIFLCVDSRAMHSALVDIDEWRVSPSIQPPIRIMSSLSVLVRGSSLADTVINEPGL
jgi:hypothetical protein